MQYCNFYLSKGSMITYSITSDYTVEKVLLNPEQIASAYIDTVYSHCICLDGGIFDIMTSVVSYCV